MALISRVIRLFRADAHAVLDRIEEPEILLKQSLREMEHEIQNAQQSLALLEIELKQNLSRHADDEQSLVDTEQELDICFTADNHDLAKVLIRRKLELQHMVKFLVKKRKSIEEAIADTKSKLSDQRSRFTSMQQKSEIFTTHSTDTGDDYQRYLHSVNGNHIRDEDVEIAFLREQQRRNSQ